MLTSTESEAEPKSEPRPAKLHKPLAFRQGTIVLFTRGKLQTYTEAGLAVTLKPLNQADLVEEFRATIDPATYPEDEINTFMSWLVAAAYIEPIDYDVWYLGKQHKLFKYSKPRLAARIMKRAFALIKNPSLLDKLVILFTWARGKYA